jgi:hypothetical protein
LRVRVVANQCGNRKREGKAVGFHVVGGFAVFWKDLPGSIMLEMRNLIGAG